MLLYRVHPWIDGVDPSAPYGPLFIPPGQGAGRWDNPDLYALRYFSTTADGAIAETFGHLAGWSSAMFTVPGPHDARRALSTYEFPDPIRLTDLADPEVLTGLGIRRVTDVIERSTRRTQRLAARIFEDGAWDGISWWSYYHPTVTLIATWRQADLRCTATRPLTLEDADVEGAARLIVRSLR